MTTTSPLTSKRRGTMEEPSNFNRADYYTFTDIQKKYNIKTYQFQFWRDGGGAATIKPLSYFYKSRFIYILKSSFDELYELHLDNLTNRSPLKYKIIEALNIEKEPEPEVQ